MRSTARIIRFVGLFFAGMATCLPSLSSAQGTYPTRQINILVPYPAGGVVDLAARLVADGLRERFNTSVIVTNKPGANGKIALGELSRSTPDGYTLLVNNDGGIGIPAALDVQFRLQPGKDYEAIAQVADSKYVLAVRGNLPVENLAGLVRLAKARPGELNFGSAGLGTSPHLAMEMLMRQTGTSMVHVPYRGGAPAMVDLLQGSIDVLVTSLTGVQSHLQSGSVRILAVVDGKRIPLIPAVPTVAEAGLAPIQVSGWLGIFGPVGIPRPVLEELSAEIKIALEDPTRMKRLSDVGAEASFRGVDEFRAFYDSEVAKWKKFGAETGIKISE